MTSEPGSLSGQVALITGAARGQGRSHAVALARLGATIVACDGPAPMQSVNYALGSLADLEHTAKLVEAEGAACRPLALDVRDHDAVASVVEATRAEFGRIDILLANAGIAVTGPLCDTDDVAWRELVETNLTGVFLVMREVIPVMRERRYGRIVVTSSMAGRMGIPNLAPYAATKWGVIGLAKSAALEVAKEGITINVVCPTTVATPMVLNESMYSLYAPDVADPTGGGEIKEEVLERFRRVNPIPEPWIEAEAITRAVVHLVTDPGVLSGTVMEVSLGSSARLH